MALNRLNARWLRPALATLALAALALLGGCGGGSGAPNNPYAPKPVAPGPLLIVPSSITVYANTPALLTILGGVAPYLVASANPALLPVGSSTSTGTVVLLPGNVAMTESVLITVTDSAGTQAQATATVQPAPIFNTLTITPASSACGANTICSGQTGTAAVTVTGPGGAGIPGRQVRFDVISGAFAIQSSDPANPLVASLTVVSDQFGHAQVIIQANVAAPTQPAQLRATDVTSGEQQTGQFTIVQTINGSAVLSVVPATATITGPDNATCSAGFTVTYYIYGGTPPYTVASTFPNAVGVFGVPVLMSGGAFRAVTNGTCVNPLVFTIRDATGLQTTATLLNLVGTATPPTPPPSPITVSPPSYTVMGAGSCTGKTFNFTLSGGTAPFSVASSGAVIVPNPVTTSPGSFGISNFADGSGKNTILIGDASKPQLTAAASVTCN
ncbi:MAG TPA: hypothetical protein VG425_05055 [Casimicrobiaceae bacterium]|jgi:hypothetical protein|nr:hypothetical protein [Casimicrobiaceae bacterium]